MSYFEEDGIETNQIMQMILLAGDAQNLSLKAFDLMAQGEESAAGEALEEARAIIGKAHGIHSEFLKKVTEVRPNLLLIHALDHLTMAQTYNTLAKKMLAVLEKRGEGKEGNYEHTA